VRGSLLPLCPLDKDLKDFKPFLKLDRASNGLKAGLGAGAASAKAARVTMSRTSERSMLPSEVDGDCVWRLLLKSGGVIAPSAICSERAV